MYAQLGDKIEKTKKIAQFLKLRRQDYLLLGRHTHILASQSSSTLTAESRCRGYFRDCNQRHTQLSTKINPKLNLESTFEIATKDIQALHAHRINHQHNRKIHPAAHLSYLTLYMYMRLFLPFSLSLSLSLSTHTHTHTHTFS